MATTVKQLRKVTGKDALMFLTSEEYMSMQKTVPRLEIYLNFGNTTQLIEDARLLSQDRSQTPGEYLKIDYSCQKIIQILKGFSERVGVNFFLDDFEKLVEFTNTNPNEINSVEYSINWIAYNLRCLGLHFEFRAGGREMPGDF